MSSPINNARGFEGGGEFYKLELGTQFYIEKVYNTLLRLMPRNDAKNSYRRLRRALRCVGVLPECNLEDRSTPDVLIAQRVHQQRKDAKLYARFCDLDFDYSALTKEAYGRHWNLGDLKIIVAKWMRGKNPGLLLKLRVTGEKLLAKYEVNHRNSKVRQHVNEGSHSAVKAYVTEWTARNHEGSSPGQRDTTGAVVEEEPTIKADTKRVSGLENSHMNAEALRLVENVRNASKVVEWETAKLVAHLMKSAQKHAPSRIPPHMRIEPACPIEYPWRNARTERGSGRRRR